MIVVSTENRATYTKIIDSILASSDLNTISEKRIRRGLQDTLGYDITSQKVGFAHRCALEKTLRFTRLTSFFVFFSFFCRLL